MISQDFRRQIVFFCLLKCQLGNPRGGCLSLASIGWLRQNFRVNVGNSVRKAIDDWEHRDSESAMLHACNAVDGTARKLYPGLDNNRRFTRVLRENCAILGPMGAPGINLVETRFPGTVPRSTTDDGRPDIAAVIYGIHRCTHGHGDELPSGFELIPDAAGPPRRTHMYVERGKVRLSDRVIFGLLAVAVLSPANRDQRVPAGYHLTFGESARLEISDWWGRASDFPAIAAQDPTPLVTLDFTNLMP
jgi:hypothetical protein